MKYIRTKDEKIYLINKDLFEEDTFHFTNKDGIATILIEEKKLSILGKVADTIEELCDEFVHITNIGNHILGQFWSPDSSDVVYGAIWTNKGLIYVAKMNEKGELELL